MNLTRVFAMVLMLTVASVCMAHSASNGFVTMNLSGTHVRGTLELAIRDGELATGLDTNGDGKVTWGELQGHQDDIGGYVATHMLIGSTEGDCPLHFGALLVNERVDGNYLWLPFDADCSQAPQDLRIDYRLLQDIDPSHRGLLTLAAWGGTQSAVLGGQASIQTFSPGPSAWRTFRQYLHTGVWHIWSGFDHLLFLLTLLLPAVLLRREGHWEAVTLARPALFNIIRVVTAFTLAHSITLTLAALDIVRLPNRLTESVIAASVVIAALNNVFPRITEGNWRLAFGFGLLHGFGFASILTDMGLSPAARLLSLLSFNAGVEVGQLAVVLVAMPLAYAIRKTDFYRRTLLPWGSTAIASVAMVWLVQRAGG